MKKIFFALALMGSCLSPAFAASQQYDTQLYFFDAQTLGKVTPATTLINVWVGIKGSGNIQGAIPLVGNCEVYDLGGYLLPFEVVNTWATDDISTNTDGTKIMPLTQIRIYSKFKGLPNHPPQGGIIINATFTLGQGDNAISMRASQLVQFGNN